jgi:RNA polymerase-binding transcription factor DksA
MTSDTALPCADTGATRDLLLQQHQAHTEEIERLAALLTEVEDPVGDEPGALAARLLDTTRLLHDERTALAEAEAALERLADGTYGRCEDCWKPIAAARLELLPRARCCVQCQSLRSRRA